jgi:hypothetical protein
MAGVPLGVRRVFWFVASWQGYSRNETEEKDLIKSTHVK